MDKFEWNETFSMGSTKLDEHNKELINLINALYDREQHLSPSKVLDDVIDYISYRFSEEEDELIQIQYPGIKKQLEQHQQFVEAILSMTEQAFDQKLTIISIRLFLKEWIEQHIQIEDYKVLQYKKDLEELKQKYV